MGWAGGIAGFFAGKILGGSLGGLLGGLLGSYIEERCKRQTGNAAFGETPHHETSYDEGVFLGAMAAMLAKMAKADGVVQREEIAAIEAFYRRMGLSSAQRNYMIRVFRAAKEDSHSIYEYAEDFADAVRDADFRTIFYDCLWDVACADGRVAPEEEAILRNICRHLRIPQTLFHAQARVRLKDGGYYSRRERRTYRAATNPLQDAYDVLGAMPSATDDELRNLYREKAKKFHPDRLRAQGLSDAMVAKATDQMAKINAAWDEIKKSRRL